MSSTLVGQIYSKGSMLKFRDHVESRKGTGNTETDSAT
jgi:hypothetical protein